MASKPQQTEEQDAALTTLNVAIDSLNHSKELSTVTPAKAIFGSVGVLLATIRVLFAPLCGDELPAHVLLGLRG